MTRVLEDPTGLPPTYLRAAPDFHAPPLSDTITADVAVVGAGYTGLSTALHLRLASLSVAVLEARTVGWGGSGRAFGQVVPYAKHDHAHVLRTFGPEHGNRLIDGLGAGPDLVFNLITRYAMSCEAQKTGLIFAAHTPAAARDLEAKARFLQTRGVRAEILDAAGTERVTGSRYYQTVLVEPRGGTLNPLAYARGLALAAVSEGARLFEASRATAVRRQGKRWLVETSNGRVEARFVVLATDAYTDDLWPGLRQTIIPLRGYQIVSEPLSDNLARAILPGGHPLTDTRRLFSGIRKRADNRLHVSIDGPAFDIAGHPSAAKATQRVRDVYPHIGELKWQEEVSGWVGMTTDQYPHMHRLDDGVFAAVGLSGRGIAFGTLLGREVTKRILGKPEQEMLLPLTPLRPFVVRPIARPLIGALINWYRLRDRADLAQGYVGARSA
jgi:glycine/D-amino acid oxidase-like deaminating enzyme